MNLKEIEKNVFDNTGVKLSINSTGRKLEIRIGHRLIETFETYMEVVAYCLGMIQLAKIKAN